MSAVCACRGLESNVEGRSVKNELSRHRFASSQKREWGCDDNDEGWIVLGSPAEMLVSTMGPLSLACDAMLSIRWVTTALSIDGSADVRLNEAMSNQSAKRKE